MFNKSLEGLEPKRVFELFDELCQIPHGSNNEKAISDYVRDFAIGLGLDTYQDKVNNLIIRKDATPGYEDLPIVVLEAHLDMVCQKTPESSHDFEKDPIEVVVDGDDIHAKDTTLGADDGTGVAFAMCVMESKTLKHPALEIVLTVNEEAGMTGIRNLEFDRLKGRVILNLDCSDEGIVVGCAGTSTYDVKLPVSYSENDAFDAFCKVSVSGLIGGHSGLMATHCGANANAIVARFLSEVPVDYALVSYEGGLVDNAITRESEAVIALSSKDREKLSEFASFYQKKLRNEYVAKDEGITIEVSDAEKGRMLDEVSTRKAVAIINVSPNGLIRMSKDVEGLAELSANIGYVRLEEGFLDIHFMARARYGSGKSFYRSRIRQLAWIFGAGFEILSDAPEWEYKPDSRLSRLINRIFNEEYGRDILVEISHGGNECGAFFQAFPDADIVCSGTKITGAHTTEETVKVSTVQKEWKMLCRTLEGMKDY